MLPTVPDKVKGGGGGGGLTKGGWGVRESVVDPRSVSGSQAAGRQAHAGTQARRRRGMRAGGPASSEAPGRRGGRGKKGEACQLGGESDGFYRACVLGCITPGSESLGAGMWGHGLTVRSRAPPEEGRFSPVTT